MKTLSITTGNLEEAINVAIRQLYADKANNEDQYSVMLKYVLVQKNHGFIEKTYVLECILL